MSDDDVIFVADIPVGMRKNNGKYQKLLENPGVWAEYWGQPRSLHSVLRTVSREGFRFEGHVRDGKAYIRAMKL